MTGPRMNDPASIAMIGAVRAYKLFVSPLLGHNCRYLPSCSDYAIEAIRTHGPASGGWLTAKRLCRCHPWGGDGYDPVPPFPIRRPIADSR
jgi:putative membrane protein insertion efficiency factor